jgi:ADP-ribose pyrophosphatase YjhB (NUDIX family)
MEKKSRIFVGILIVTKLKLSADSPEELVAILQRRGKIDTENENGFKWQSFAGLCEMTSYGKAEPGETPEQALEREMAEELGEKAKQKVLASNPKKLYEKTEDDGDKIFVWTTFLSSDILKDFKLDISTGGMEIIKRSDLDNLIYKDFGGPKFSVTDLNNITITSLPKKYLEKAFEIN